MQEVKEMPGIQGDRAQCYYKNDMLHRLDGPARIEYAGDKVVLEEWRVTGVLHRENGPAITFYDNGIPYCQEWLIHGEVHRTDGPAVVCYYDDGSYQEAHWFINGVRQKCVLFNHPSCTA